VALIVFANDITTYVGESPPLEPVIEDGSYRKVEDGWEVLGVELTEGCNPILETRYLLHLGITGVLTRLCSQVAYVDCGACI
jgi:hypothetical protein